MIAFCIDGLWEDVVIDDQIPCGLVRGERGQLYKTPLYNRTKKDDSELWVCLLEKAWAKIF